MGLCYSEPLKLYAETDADGNIRTFAMPGLPIGNLYRDSEGHFYIVFYARDTTETPEKVGFPIFLETGLDVEPIKVLSNKDIRLHTEVQPRYRLGTPRTIEFSILRYSTFLEEHDINDIQELVYENKQNLESLENAHKGFVKNVFGLMRQLEGLLKQYNALVEALGAEEYQADTDDIPF